LDTHSNIFDSKLSQTCRKAGTESHGAYKSAGLPIDEVVRFFIFGITVSMFCNYGVSVGQTSDVKSVPVEQQRTELSVLDSHLL